MGVVLRHVEEFLGPALMLQGRPGTHYPDHIIWRHPFIQKCVFLLGHCWRFILPLHYYREYESGARAHN